MPPVLEYGPVASSGLFGSVVVSSGGALSPTESPLALSAVTAAEHGLRETESLLGSALPVLYSDDELVYATAHAHIIAAHQSLSDTLAQPPGSSVQTSLPVPHATASAALASKPAASSILYAILSSSSRRVGSSVLRSDTSAPTPHSSLARNQELSDSSAPHFSNYSDSFEATYISAAMDIPSETEALVARADGGNCGAQSGTMLTGGAIAGIVLASIIGTSLAIAGILLYFRRRHLQNRKRESNLSWIVGSRMVTPLPPPHTPRFPPSNFGTSEEYDDGSPDAATTSLHSASPLVKRTTPSDAPVINITVAHKGAVPRSFAQYVHPRPIVPSIHYTYPRPAIELGSHSHTASASSSSSPTPSSSRASTPVFTRASTPASTRGPGTPFVPTPRTSYLLAPAVLRARPDSPHTAQSIRIATRLATASPQPDARPRSGEVSPASTTATALLVPLETPLGSVGRESDATAFSRRSSRASSSFSAFSAGPLGGRRSRGDSIDPHRFRRAPPSPPPEVPSLAMWREHVGEHARDPQSTVSESDARVSDYRGVDASVPERFEGVH